MTPTAKLRWVERKENASISDPVYVHYVRTVRVLQQWWDKDYDDDFGEWRDIEIAREE